MRSTIISAGKSCHVTPLDQRARHWSSARSGVCVPRPLTAGAVRVTLNRGIACGAGSFGKEARTAANNVGFPRVRAAVATAAGRRMSINFRYAVLYKPGRVLSETTLVRPKNHTQFVVTTHHSCCLLFAQC